VNLRKLSLEEWNEMSKDAHLLCFSEERNPEMNRCNFALLITDEKDVPVAYSTIVELDSLSAYMQHGGAFPEFQGTTKVARAYHLMLAYLKEHYLKITTRIKNTNIAMLKLALSADLLVSGIDYVTGDLFLNLFWLDVQCKS